MTCDNDWPVVDATTGGDAERVEDMGDVDVPGYGEPAGCDGDAGYVEDTGWVEDTGYVEPIAESTFDSYAPAPCAPSLAAVAPTTGPAEVAPTPATSAPVVPTPAVPAAPGTPVPAAPTAPGVTPVLAIPTTPGVTPTLSAQSYDATGRATHVRLEGGVLPGTYETVTLSAPNQMRPGPGFEAPPSSVAPVHPTAALNSPEYQEFWGRMAQAERDRIMGTSTGIDSSGSGYRVNGLTFDNLGDAIQERYDPIDPQFQANPPPER